MKSCGFDEAYLLDYFKVLTYSFIISLASHKMKQKEVEMLIPERTWPAAMTRGNCYPCLELHQKGEIEKNAHSPQK